MGAEFYLWIAAAALVLAPLQAHRLLPRLVPQRAPLWALRALLAVLGLVVGAAAAVVAAGAGLPVLAAGLLGLGAVHLPAAVILALKQAQPQPGSS